jgi:KaiC/GvpD/RAD55 family RecA-like ATPase
VSDEERFAAFKAGAERLWLEHLNGATKEGPTQQEVSEFPSPVSTDDVDPIPAEDMEEPGPRAWVVRELIPAKWPTILYGDGGVGKTTLSNHLACCVATGMDWLGREVVPCNVLVVDAELDAEEFARRMWPIARGLGLERPPTGVYYWRLPKALSRDDVQARMSHFIKRYEIGLLVVDSLTLATHLSDQNVSGDISQLIFTLNKRGVATLLLDHHARQRGDAGEDSRVDPYGSVMKRNLSRSAIYLSEYGEGLIRLRPNKVSFTARWEPFVLEARFSSESITYNHIAENDPRVIVAKSRDTNEQIVDAIQDCMESDDTMRRTGVPLERLAPLFPELSKGDALRMRCNRLAKTGRLLKTGTLSYAIPTLLPLA